MKLYTLKDSGVGSTIRRISIKGMSLMMAVSMLCVYPAEIFAAETSVSAQQSKKQASDKKTSKNRGGAKSSSKSTGNSANKSAAKSSSAKAGKQPAKQSVKPAADKSTKAGSKPAAKATGKKKDAKSVAPSRSAADLKRQQQSAQAEIQKTREEIRKNEQQVKQGLNELSRLEDDIAVSKKETATLSSEVGKLNGKITTLETNIAKHQDELDRLRAEYLKAVKKMRISRKRNSEFAYIFSAKDIAQADRRMRYLKEFSEWKTRQTKQINEKVATLNSENKQLKLAKNDKDVMLGRELKAQQKLTEQKQRQDVIVADLKANGDVLQAHLAKKQSEVNALKNQVAAVIAEEQRRAEEKRRAEQQRQAEIERKRKQEEARKERERIEREQAAEAARKREAEAKSKQDTKKDVANTESPKATPNKETPKKETPKKESPKKETPKNETPKKETSKKEESKSGDKDYASARQRKPRSNSGQKETPKKDTPKKDTPKEQSNSKPKQETPKSQPQKETQPGKGAAASSGDFAAMKGSLPRPVSGAWRVTGKFGRHALPDLPDVTYDNPGIDVDVSKGASVNSVFRGTVSGVYMVPGFATVVIVCHGDYYTVYGNVASAAVKVGDTVKQGQHLGKVAEDADNPGHGAFHFEVWKGREKLNPSSWIR